MSKQSKKEEEEEVYRYFVSKDVEAVVCEEDSSSRSSSSGTSVIHIGYQYRDWEENAVKCVRESAVVLSCAADESMRVEALSSVIVPSSVLSRVVSPSGHQYVQFVRCSCKKKNSFEVQLWKDSSCVYRIPLSSKPIVESRKWILGGCSWSSDESYVVFGSSCCHDDSVVVVVDDNDNTCVSGDEFVVSSMSWGEGFADPSLNEVTMMVLRVSTGQLREIQGLPSSKAVGQPCFVSSNTIVMTTWQPHSSHKLGLLYCTNRPSQLISSSNPFLLSAAAAATDNTTTTTTTTCKVLTANQVLATSPTTTTIDGQTYLVYLGHDTGYSTHFGNMALHAIPIHDDDAIEEQHRQVWIPTVDLPTNDSTFPGIFTLSLPHATDGQLYKDQHDAIYINTQWHSTNAVITIHPNTKTIQRPFTNNHHHSVELLSITSHGHIILKQSSPTSSHSIRIIPQSSSYHSSPLQLPSPSISASSYPPISAFPQKMQINNPSFQLIHTPTPHFTELTHDLPLQSILLWPYNNTMDDGTTTGDDDDDDGQHKKLPLIVFVHGGPHFGVTTKYDPNLAFLCQYAKYAILAINYRGSSGFGQTYLDSLAGRIGTLDVHDVVHVTQTVLKDYKDTIDATRVGVCGGSHGGYLACHLIGQYPHLFKVAAIRNPVTNVATMTTATDIPDWCHVETFGPTTTTTTHPSNNNNIPWIATADQLTEMYRVSPIQYASQVTSPTLIAIGMKDLRVPPSQGISYYHSLTQLKHNHTKQLLIYPNDSHPISIPKSQANHWIHIQRWFQKHL